MSNQKHIILPAEENELAKSLVYYVSRRGRNSYWARVINGTTKRYTNEEGTLSVALAPNFQYILTCHLPFFEKCSPEMRYLGLVHEAGHIVLNHIPRFFKLMANCTDSYVRTALQATYNLAMDFACNDTIVRTETEFKNCHKARDSDTGEFPFLLPEEFGLPVGKSLEEYFVLLLKGLPSLRQKIDRMLADVIRNMEDAAQRRENAKTDQEKKEGSSAAADETNTTDEENNSSSQPGTSNRPSSREIQRRKSAFASQDITGLPESLIEHALNEPEIFEKMQELFNRLTGGNHQQWNALAENMTPEEAISAGNKMKGHAKKLVRTANEQTSRDRGTISARMQALIEELLAPEQIPWDAFLKDLMQSAVSARVLEEMTSPNLALINEDHMEPWPGQTLDFAFNITWVTDTSGSMADTEYARACACLNSLLTVNKGIKVTYMECDAQIQKEVQVTNIEPPTDEYLAEQNKRRGYGGTVYTPFFKRILNVDTPGDWIAGAPRLEEVHPKPDLLVVCTDGGVVIKGECFPQFHPGCPIIWLVMPKCNPAQGMDNIAPDRVVQMFHMREDDA